MLKTIAGLACAACLAVTVGCSQTDAGITTKVKSKFATDPMVKAYQVDVTTNDHVVTLSGDVETTAAREQAVRLARQTEGVRDVVDRLRVNEAAATSGFLNRDADDQAEHRGESVGDKARDTTRKTGDKAGDIAHDAGNAISDAAVTTAVKTKFLADTAVKGTKIDVDTNNGVVTLSGTVNSRAEANRAVMIAKQTDGVKSVVNKLHVGAKG